MLDIFLMTDHWLTAAKPAMIRVSRLNSAATKRVDALDRLP